tara:strand:- start:1008 stop:1550 length:543 start_codon:yes stop_codon:yes gene_type:complete
MIYYMKYRRKYKYVILILLFLIIFYLYFNRTPTRYNSIYSSNIILSPCDGTVMFAEGRNISIFLSPFDVHAQYSPIDGFIKDIEIIHGKAYMANKPESIHNEGVKVIFSSDVGDIEVVQRVGFFVRRIQNYIKVNDVVKRGENYGKINFGSRVDILLPINYTTNLQIGQTVFAGTTKISE